jgi:hypothetical protein
MASLVFLCLNLTEQREWAGEPEDFTGKEDEQAKKEGLPRGLVSKMDELRKQGHAAFTD